MKLEFAFTTSRSTLHTGVRRQQSGELGNDGTNQKLMNVGREKSLASYCAITYALYLP